MRPRNERTIGREGARRVAGVRECDVTGEFLVVRVSGEHGAAHLVDFGDDVQVLAIARRPERPLVVGEDAERAIPRAVVGQREQREPHRIVGVDEDVQLVVDAVSRAGEACDAGRMADDRAPGRGRAMGPGVGDHDSPVSSSRTKRASPVGSAIGSFANGVSRFSRLLPAHVCAAPEAVTIVPKCGFAMMLTHGIGVSSAPSSAIAYVRPSSVKPPRPLLSVVTGTAPGGIEGRLCGDEVGTSGAVCGWSASGRSSCVRRSPASPRSTTRATASSRTRSARPRPSARSR